MVTCWRKHIPNLSMNIHVNLTKVLGQVSSTLPSSTSKYQVLLNFKVSSTSKYQVLEILHQVQVLYLTPTLRHWENQHCFCWWPDSARHQPISTHKVNMSLKVDICGKHMQFPHSAFARGPHSPALEEGMRAAMGATREYCAGLYA